MVQTCISITISRTWSYIASQSHMQKLQPPKIGELRRRVSRSAVVTAEIFGSDRAKSRYFSQHCLHHVRLVRDVPMLAPPLTGAVHPSPRELAPEHLSASQGQTAPGRAPNEAPGATGTPDHPERKRRTTEGADAPMPHAELEHGQSAQPEGGGAKAKVATAAALAPRMVSFDSGTPPPPAVRGGHARVHQPARTKPEERTALRRKMRQCAGPSLSGRTPGHARPRKAWPDCTSCAHTACSSSPSH